MGDAVVMDSKPHCNSHNTAGEDPVRLVVKRLSKSKLKQSVPTATMCLRERCWMRSGTKTMVLL